MLNSVLWYLGRHFSNTRHHHGIIAPPGVQTARLVFFSRGQLGVTTSRAGTMCGGTTANECHIKLPCLKFTTLIYARTVPRSSGTQRHAAVGCQCRQRRRLTLKLWWRLQRLFCRPAGRKSQQGQSLHSSRSCSKRDRIDYACTGTWCALRSVASLQL